MAVFPSWSHDSAVPVSRSSGVGSDVYAIRQARQAAIRELTGFLEQEIQRTLTKTRLELEETLAERSLGDAVPIGSLERVEQACRGLMRIETILNEILDNAKPLELHRRVVRVQDVIESALAVIADETAQHRIIVTRDLSAALPPIKADEGKLQQVFPGLRWSMENYLAHPGAQCHQDDSDVPAFTRQTPQSRPSPNPFSDAFRLRPAARRESGKPSPNTPKTTATDLKTKPSGRSPLIHPPPPSLDFCISVR
jgi:hypothetical protein